MKKIDVQWSRGLALCYNALVRLKPSTLAATLLAIIFALPCAAAKRSHFASNAGLDLTPVVWIFCGLILIGVVCGVIAAIVSAAKEKRLNEKADAAFKKWAAAVEANGRRLPIYDSGIHLKKGELCYFKDSTATLLEPRSVRSGGFGGASIRVVKGISIHSGRFASESHDEWRAITTGTLYVTNRRIIFDGATKNREILMPDVMSVHPGFRLAVVNSHKLQKPVGFGTINGQIFATVVDSISEGATVS